MAITSDLAHLDRTCNDLDMILHTAEHNGVLPAQSEPDHDPLDALIDAANGWDTDPHSDTLENDVLDHITHCRTCQAHNDIMCITCARPIGPGHEDEHHPQYIVNR
jgi:hypothetical protein